MPKGSKRKASGAQDGIVHRLVDLIRGANPLHLKIKAKSGRVFNYHFDAKSINVYMTDSQISSLVEELIRAKYRLSKWDIENPQFNTEEEVRIALTSFARLEIERLKRVDERKKAEKSADGE